MTERRYYPSIRLHGEPFYRDPRPGRILMPLIVIAIGLVALALMTHPSLDRGPTPPTTSTTQGLDQ